MANFSTLKKNSESLDRLAKAIETINTPQTNADEDTRYWQPEVDKAGNGFATIRFLPAPAIDGEDALPWVRLFSHGFKGPTGKWYIENSLTTLNQTDPVGEFNTKLWQQSTDDNSWQRKQVREQKRKLSYISCIQVISDPKNPENEGKVFLYRYGKKIFDKITEIMNPQYGDDPVNPFDFWKGANFKLKIRMKDSFRNYDLSTFEPASALSTNDDELEKIWNSEYSLLAEIAPSKFKTYEELKAQLDKVLSNSGEEVAGLTRTEVQREPVARSNQFDPDPSTKDDKATEDDDMSFFKKLAEED